MGLFGLFKSKKQVAPQEFEIKWGTLMPVMTRAGAIRARGSCTVVVNDPGLFAEKIGAPENIFQVRNMILRHVTDQIGELSFTGELTQVIGQPGLMEADLRVRLEPDLHAVGLLLQLLSVESVERI